MNAAPSMTKQFSIRSLFVWMLVIAAVIVLVQQLGAWLSWILSLLIFGLAALVGVLIIFFSSIIWLSIANTPDLNQSENLSKCRKLLLIGVMMCVPMMAWFMCLYLHFNRF